MQTVDKTEIERFIRNALYEDIRDGDHTSLACVPDDAIGKARLLVKDDGILAGLELTKHIFEYVNPNLRLTTYIGDGATIRRGDIAFEVQGFSRDILKAERLVLNTLQRMSGIATLSRQFVKAVEGTKVQILDTRKTTPLLRFLEKWAVRIGGATNYREGLYDWIMIKDNHIDLCGGIASAIRKVNAYLKEKQLELKITIEVRDLKELDEVLLVGKINRIMLDNFDIELIKKAVRRIEGNYEVEASGGITLENARAYAETGVDFISVGALTHSFKSLDLSLKKY